MKEDDGLLFALVLDGRGGGRALDWDGIAAWRPADGVLWVHLDRTREHARDWVEKDSGVDAAVAESLLMAEGNRPRVQRVDDALLLVLRGLNRAVGQHPDDMPAMHMWITAERIISLRRRRLMAGNNLREAVLAGRGPRGASSFLVEMADQLGEPVGPAVAELDDRIDELQERVLGSYDAGLRKELQEARQAVINFRRHIAPQRDALSRLQNEHVSWLESLDRSYLREIADRTARFVEDLDAARERAVVTQDELNNQLADRMNKTMYLLTILSALLLPPSLLTGLFGINVGGMPGVENEWAFSLVLVLIPALAVVEFWALRRLKWI